MIAWKLFYNPITLGFDSLLWLLPPLCLAVVIVYKALRIRDIRRLPRQAAVLMVYVLAGLAGLGLLGVALLWLYQHWRW